MEFELSRYGSLEYGECGNGLSGWLGVVGEVLDRGMGGIEGMEFARVVVDGWRGLVD